VKSLIVFVVFAHYNFALSFFLVGSAFSMWPQQDMQFADRSHFCAASHSSVSWKRKNRRIQLVAYRQAEVDSAIGTRLHYIERHLFDLICKVDLWSAHPACYDAQFASQTPVAISLLEALERPDAVQASDVIVARDVEDQYGASRKDVDASSNGDSKDGVDVSSNGDSKEGHSKDEDLELSKSLQGDFGSKTLQDDDLGSKTSQDEDFDLSKSLQEHDFGSKTVQN